MNIAGYRLEYHGIKLLNFDSHLRLVVDFQGIGHDSIIAGALTTGQTVSAAARAILVPSPLLALSNLQPGGT